jgi:hypothetical protein
MTAIAQPKSRENVKRKFLEVRRLEEQNPHFRATLAPENAKMACTRFG